MADQTSITNPKALRHATMSHGLLQNALMNARNFKTHAKHTSGTLLHSATKI
ncbi:hypothetical protein [Gimesia panareensis]|uniref:hypothetical protein n=1 Tax=Gimesia panareensis TaxID=2527978 RepID=UPI0011879040|nr:hypothetical protein [Gimesia panareensis]QDU53730.1 hypothetical protein Pan110_61240 [Gimesia panareensis]